MRFDGVEHGFTCEKKKRVIISANRASFRKVARSIFTRAYSRSTVGRGVIAHVKREKSPSGLRGSKIAAIHVIQA